MMKKVTGFLFLLIILPLFVISCDPAKEFETEIAAIDSCLVEIDSLEKLLDGIEFDSLVLMVKHVERNEELIKKYYYPDTLDEELGKRMNGSKSIRKSLRNVMTDKSVYGDEFNAIKHQLMDLREDIVNGIFTKEQIDEYMTIEMASLSKVSISFADFNAMQLEKKQIFYTMVPEVDKLVEKLMEEVEGLE